MRCTLSDRKYGIVSYVLIVSQKQIHWIGESVEEFSATICCDMLATQIIKRDMVVPLVELLPGHMVTHRKGR